MVGRGGFVRLHRPRGLGQDASLYGSAAGTTGYNPLDTNLDLPWDYLPTTYTSGIATTLADAPASITATAATPTATGLSTATWLLIGGGALVLLLAFGGRR